MCSFSFVRPRFSHGAFFLAKKCGKLSARDAIDTHTEQDEEEEEEEEEGFCAVLPG